MSKYGSGGYDGKYDEPSLVDLDTRVKAAHGIAYGLGGMYRQGGVVRLLGVLREFGIRDPKNVERTIHSALNALQDKNTALLAALDRANALLVEAALYCEAADELRARIDKHLEETKP